VIIEAVNMPLTALPGRPRYEPTRTDAASRRISLSCLRELMSSLPKTLRKWYSTVRGLMNSCAPISGSSVHRRPGGQSAPPGRQAVAGVGRALAHGLARRDQLTAGALGEGVGADRAEHVMGDAQLLAGVDAAMLSPQPLAVDETRARELDADAGPREPLDRLAVQGARDLALAHQTA